MAFARDSDEAIPRRQPCKASDSGSPMPNVAPRDFVTTSGATQEAAWDGEHRASAHRVTAGTPRTCRPDFNIITGGAALVNNSKFEFYSATDDARRTR